MKKKKHVALRHDTLGAQLAGVPEDDIALRVLQVLVQDIVVCKLGCGTWIGPHVCDPC